MIEYSCGTFNIEYYCSLVCMAVEPAAHSCLQQKPSEKDLDNISKEVGGGWRSLLMQLGVPYATIEQLLQKHSGDPSAACLNGLVLWRNGSEKYCPPTWSSLLEALRSAEKVELAQELERDLLKDAGHHPQGAIIIICFSLGPVRTGDVFLQSFANSSTIMQTVGCNINNIIMQYK